MSDMSSNVFYGSELGWSRLMVRADQPEAYQGLYWSDIGRSMARHSQAGIHMQANQNLVICCQAGGGTI